jgi:hypothetical protein
VSNILGDTRRFTGEGFWIQCNDITNLTHPNDFIGICEGMGDGQHCLVASMKYHASSEHMSVPTLFLKEHKKKLVNLLGISCISNHELWLPWESRIVVTAVLLPVACV